MNFEIALIAYAIDRIFGEFSFLKFYRHPVIFMGDFIEWFEKHFYRDSLFRGVILALALLFLIFIPIFLIDSFVENSLLLGLIASMGLASKSLYESIKDIAQNPQNIEYLVSRDTKDLSLNEINRAAIESYSENLSDGVVAPLFYLLLFGLYGLFIYKGVSTLDSMVGYRNDKYERFGKFSARLDDVANFIPSRITALLIGVLFYSKNALFNFYSFGKHHKSPNAGHPISAMALALGIRLGGDSSYFGKMESKPFFGVGKSELETEDLKRALTLQMRFDLFLLTFLVLGVLCEIYI